MKGVKRINKSERVEEKRGNRKSESEEKRDRETGRWIVCK